LNLLSSTESEETDGTMKDEAFPFEDVLDFHRVGITGNMAAGVSLFSNVRNRSL